jgi:sensor histidine kinase YesM
MIMKQSACILFFYLFFTTTLFAGDKNIPEVPWRAIAFAEKQYPDFKLYYDVSVKLYGNYTEQDSLMVAKSVSLMDELTESINVGMSSQDSVNLKIWFIDSTNEFIIPNIIYLPDNVESVWGFQTFYNGENTKSRRNYDLMLRFDLVADSLKQNFITNQLIWALYPRKFDIYSIYRRKWSYHEQPHSIFKSSYPTNLNPNYLKLSDFDRSFIAAMYAKDFDELLPLAKSKFRRFHFPSWLNMEYGYAVLFWPLLLSLFLMAGLLMLVYNKWLVKIRYRFMRFNASAFIGLLFFGFLFSLYISLSYRLNFQNDSGPYWQGVLIGTGITLLFGLPAVNILRIIEMLIARRSKHRFWKSLLQFLSISLIPTITIFGIIFFSIGEDWKNGVELTFLIFSMLGFTLAGLIRALINFFILKERDIKVANETQLAQLRELKTKAELNALHSKINPHFLYNSLNSIAGLCRINPEKTEHMALALSRLFRYSINREQSDWATLGEEINMVKIYLEIEKVRFDDRLEFIIDLPNSLIAEKVPRFILQPLVENALKHGVSNSTELGIVSVSVLKKNEWLEIMVADNGPAFPDDLIPGFGVQGIYDKLEIMYPNSFELHFINEPEKKIVIKLK